MPFNFKITFSLVPSQADKIRLIISSVKNGSAGFIFVITVFAKRFAFVVSSLISIENLRKSEVQGLKKSQN
jgi:hypothetical protein